MPVRIAVICGTRPEIVKLAPVLHVLRKEPWAEVEWIHTGQHSAMADSMLDCFRITPSVRLSREGSRIEDFSASCRRQLDHVLQERSFDYCLVQGDTESAFLGALCAFYRHMRIGHVEAGLRTYNLARPFPEEGLRQMISRLADDHFAPTSRAVQALQSEGIADDRVELTGNTVVDAQEWAMREHAIHPAKDGDRFILVTVHRREHWGSDMEAIFRAIAAVAKDHPDHDILFPVHLNPIVRDAAHAALQGVGNVRLVGPLDYLDTQRALARASLVLTDSGGLQEEAPTFHVPVAVLRNETERPEAVEAGFATLVGPDEVLIRSSARELLAQGTRASLRGRPNPYGDGRAAERVAARIARHFGVETRPVAPEAEPVPH